MTKQAIELRACLKQIGVTNPLNRGFPPVRSKRVRGRATGGAFAHIRPLAAIDRANLLRLNPRIEYREYDKPLERVWFAVVTLEPEAIT